MNLGLLIKGSIILLVSSEYLQVTRVSVQHVHVQADCFPLDSQQLETS